MSHRQDGTFSLWTTAGIKQIDSRTMRELSQLSGWEPVAVVGISQVHQFLAELVLVDTAVSITTGVREVRP